MSRLKMGPLEILLAAAAVVLWSIVLLELMEVL